MKCADVLRSGIVAALVTLGAGSVFSQDLKSYQEMYRKNSDALKQGFQPKFDALQQQYRKSLEELKTSAQNQGDLLRTKAATAEFDRFLKEKSMPAATDMSAVPDIKALQTAYVKQFTVLDVELSASLGALTVKYDQALDRLQIELTKADKLDEATAVLEERNKAQESVKAFAEKKAALKALPTPNSADKEASQKNPTAKVLPPAEPSITSAEAKRISKQSIALFEQQWDTLPGKVFTVEANPRNECVTGIVIAKNERYLAIPCPTDRWNTSPNRWGDVDFRGHTDEAKASNGMPYMRLCYALDGGRLEPLISKFIIDKPGRLLFAPSDREGGGGPQNNKGSVRVKVIKILK